MNKTQIFKINLFFSSIALLASTPIYAYESGSVNFNYLSGPNQFSSGVVAYELDFSEFTCSDYGGIVDCEDGEDLSIIRVTGLNYVTSFTAAFSNLSVLPTTKTFTKADLTDFSIYIDQFGNFLSTPSFVGNEIYTNEVYLLSGVPLPPSEDGWQATVDFVNGQTIYTADNPSFPLPEPLTILGASTAIAFGAAFKRRIKKSD
jgi:hypothetical protein